MGVWRVVFVPVNCSDCGKRGEPVRLPKPGEAKAVLKCASCKKRWTAGMRNYPVRDRGKGW